MKIIKRLSFDCAHQLWNSQWSEEENLAVYGKCTRLHGHTYNLSVVVSGNNDATGMVINFRDLGEIIKQNVIERYDHYYLNDLEEFRNKPTTSENIAQEIFNRLAPLLEQFDGIKLEEIRLSETPSSEAIVTAITN